MKRHTVILCGTLAVVGWFLVFGLGLLVNSKPYRDAVATEFMIGAFLFALITYTPTNLAFLCILAAFSGGSASRLIHTEPLDARPTRSHGGAHGVDNDSEVYRRENPFSSMFRGFVVFIAFLAGVYVGSNAPFADTSPEQYARAAGTTSLLAFVVGYDPTLFEKLIALSNRLKRSE